VHFMKTLRTPFVRMRSTALLSLEYFAANRIIHLARESIRIRIVHPWRNARHHAGFVLLPDISRFPYLRLMR
jgi:hypothetical protein